MYHCGVVVVAKKYCLPQIVVGKVEAKNLPHRSMCIVGSQALSAVFLEIGSGARLKQRLVAQASLPSSFQTIFYLLLGIISSIKL